jgi:hypothetical protein
MSWAWVVAARLRGLFGRKRLERELDDEFAFTWRCRLRTTSKLA